MLKSLETAVLKNWQSSLAGLVEGVAGSVLAATAKGQLTGPQFWGILVASFGAFVKGLVSADASATVTK